MTVLASYIPGLGLAFLISLAAIFIAPYLGAPSVLLALLIGIALSFAYQRGSIKTGVNFSAGFVLRVGVALMGFRIAFDDLMTLGWDVVLMIMLAIGCTITVGILAARLLGLRREFGLLTGGAVSICGASAAMAITSTLPDHKDKDRDLSLAVMGITGFSTLALIFYPILGQALGLDTTQLAMFLGGTIHDVAQTAGAGYSVSDEVGDLAVLTKMIRVSFILPLVLGLMMYFRTSEGDAVAKMPKPIFLFAFAAFAVLNSVFAVPDMITEIIGVVSKTALITAIAAVGLKVNIKDIIAVGAKPFLLIAIEALCIGSVVLLYITYFL